MCMCRPVCLRFPLWKCYILLLGCICVSNHSFSFCFTHKQTLDGRDLQVNATPCVTMLRGAPRRCAPFDETAWGTNQYGLNSVRSYPLSPPHCAWKETGNTYYAGLRICSSFESHRKSEEREIKQLRALGHREAEGKRLCHARLSPPAGRLLRALRGGGLESTPHSTCHT